MEDVFGVACLGGCVEGVMNKEVIYTCCVLGMFLVGQRPPGLVAGSKLFGISSYNTTPRVMHLGCSNRIR